MPCPDPPCCDLTLLLLTLTSPPRTRMHQAWPWQAWSTTPIRNVRCRGWLPCCCRLGSGRPLLAMPLGIQHNLPSDFIPLDTLVLHTEATWQVGCRGVSEASLPDTPHPEAPHRHPTHSPPRAAPPHPQPHPQAQRRERQRPPQASETRLPGCAGWVGRRDGFEATRCSNAVLLRPWPATLVVGGGSGLGAGAGSRATSSAQRVLVGKRQAKGTLGGEREGGACGGHPGSTTTTTCVELMGAHRQLARPPLCTHPRAPTSPWRPPAPAHDAHPGACLTSRVAGTAAAV